MKKIILVAFCAMSLSTFAQKRTEWTLKGGLMLSKFRGDDFNGIPLTSSSRNSERVSTQTSPTLGYTFGAQVRTLESVFLQAEMLFSVKGAQIDHYTPGGKVSTQVQYGQIDIPLSVGYKYQKIELLGGLYMSSTVYDNNKLKTFLSQFGPLKSSAYQTVTLGYHLGAGVNLNKLNFGVRYMGGFQPLVDETIFYDDPTLIQGSRQSAFLQRAAVWQFTIGYKIR